MDRILIILKKENGPRASSAPALGLNTIIFKYVYWYMKQISGERLQDHWSSGYIRSGDGVYMDELFYFFAPKHRLWLHVRTVSLKTVCTKVLKIRVRSKYFRMKCSFLQLMKIFHVCVFIRYR